MTTTTTPRFVKAITCPRCTGKGYVSSNVVYCGAPGTCMKCDGIGEVEGDRATIRAAKAAHEVRRTAGRIIYTADLGHGVLTGAPCAEKRDARIFREAVAFGWSHLEVNAPERHAKAAASILAGHPDVFVALARYAVVECGYRAMLDFVVTAPDGTPVGA